MMKEADSHAEEDKKRREEIETRNRADQAIYGAERMTKDMGDKISAEDRAAIESAMEALKKANDGGDIAAINRAMEQLTAAQHKAAEAMYRQQAPGAAAGGGAQAGGAAGGQQAPGGSSGGQGDVIDAEVVDEGKS
jgi:molecular chaperone DnaK